MPRETSGAETPPEKIKQSSDEPDCGPGTRDEQKCKDIKGCHFTQDEECLPVSHPIASAEIKSNPLNELTRTKNYQQVMLKEKLNPTEAQEEKCEKDEDCGENRECNQETKECQVKKGEEYKPPELPQPKQTTPSNPNPLTTAAQRAAQKAAQQAAKKELLKNLEKNDKFKKAAEIAAKAETTADTVRQAKEKVDAIKKIQENVNSLKPGIDRAKSAAAAKKKGYTSIGGGRKTQKNKKRKKRQTRKQKKKKPIKNNLPKVGKIVENINGTKYKIVGIVKHKNNSVSIRVTEVNPKISKKVRSKMKKLKKDGIIVESVIQYTKSMFDVNFKK